MTITGFIGAPTGSTMVPLSNLQKRTKEVPLIVTSGQTGWAVTRAVGVFYADSNGVWRVAFNVSGSITSATVTSMSSSIVGMTAKNTSGFYQPISAVIIEAGTSGALQQAYITPNSGTLNGNFASTNSVTTATFSGDVELDAEPTIYTSSANYIFATSTTGCVAAVGDTYTNNGATFTVVQALTNSGGNLNGGITAFIATGTGAPSASGTLTRSSGAGTASINFSSVIYPSLETVANIAAYIPVASGATAGLVDGNAATWNGVKTFASAPLMDSIGEKTATNGVQIQGRTNGTAIAAGYVGQVVTWATPPSSWSGFTTEADWTNATITLTAGIWVVYANISAGYSVTSNTVADRGSVYFKITDSSNNIVANEYKGFGIAQTASSSSGAFSLFQIMACTFPVVLSSPTTYKIRGIGIVVQGTGTAYLSNESGHPSEFFAVRIA